MGSLSRVGEARVTGPRTRIVIAKPGLDGHDRGARVVALALRDAGFEVIYTGLHATPAEIVHTAVQEDADAIGLSILSGAHMTIFPRVVALLHDQDAAHIMTFGGGVIPREDVTELQSLGVAMIFTPGAPLSSIVAWLRDWASQQDVDVMDESPPQSSVTRDSER
jgi:methylmalonyl-CoA mutase C-terminal domain/subunit